MLQVDLKLSKYLAKKHLKWYFGKNNNKIFGFIYTIFKYYGLKWNLLIINLTMRDRT